MQLIICSIWKAYNHESVRRMIYSNSVRKIIRVNFCKLLKDRWEIPIIIKGITAGFRASEILPANTNGTQTHLFHEVTPKDFPGTQKFRSRQCVSLPSTSASVFKRLFTTPSKSLSKHLHEISHAPVPSTKTRDR